MSADTPDSRQGLPIVPFVSQAAWEDWLEVNHANVDGIWLKIAKKNSGIESVTYANALVGALRYGWIDSQKASFDEDFYLQRFTPRRARSKWSKRNREMATELIEEGRMAPAGLEQVERAKEDGRWDAAYPSPSNATVPPDLREKLDENPAAAAFFEEIAGMNRYAILYRIHDAKKPETRARRIEKYVKMLSEGETIH